MFLRLSKFLVPVAKVPLSYSCTKRTFTSTLNVLSEQVSEVANELNSEIEVFNYMVPKTPNKTIFIGNLNYHVDARLLQNVLNDMLDPERIKIQKQNQQVYLDLIRSGKLPPEMPDDILPISIEDDLEDTNITALINEEEACEENEDNDYLEELEESEGIRRRHEEGLVREDDRFFDLPYNTFENIRIVRDKINDRKCGFAFVDFKDEDSAQRAVAMLQNIELLGRTMRVERSRVLGDKTSRERKFPPRKFLIHPIYKKKGK